MNIYDVKQSCIGCGCCEIVCPVNAITIGKNEEGFFYPKIDETKCNDCGACIKQCVAKKAPFELKPKKEAYAAHHSLVQEIKKSASGGVAYALMEYFLKRGYVTFGVAYNQDYSKCKYIRVNSRDELYRVRGSKYSQADIHEAILLIKKDLQKGKKVLFIGTPCYVGAIYYQFKQYIDQLVLVELVCSGVMSPELEQNYLDIYRKKFKHNIDYFSVKYKKHGYKWPYIMVKAGEKTYSEPLHCSDYGFVYKNFVRHSCYNCMFKSDNSCADITIGDFWGLNHKREVYEKYGVSVLIVRNERGATIIKDMDNLTMERVEYKELIKENPRIESSRRRMPIEREKSFNDIYHEQGLRMAIKRTKKVKDYIADIVKHILAVLDL